jgi:hypothetical protein
MKCLLLCVIFLVSWLSYLISSVSEIFSLKFETLLLHLWGSLYLKVLTVVMLHLWGLLGPFLKTATSSKACNMLNKL